MIELENVTKSYPMGEVAYQALRGISLEIEKGSMPRSPVRLAPENRLYFI